MSKPTNTLKNSRGTGTTPARAASATSAGFLHGTEVRLTDDDPIAALLRRVANPDLSPEVRREAVKSLSYAGPAAGLALIGYEGKHDRRSLRQAETDAHIAMGRLKSEAGIKPSDTWANDSGWKEKVHARYENTLRDFAKNPSDYSRMDADRWDALAKYGGTGGAASDEMSDATMAELGKSAKAFMEGDAKNPESVAWAAKNKKMYGKFFSENIFDEKGNFRPGITESQAQWALGLVKDVTGKFNAGKDIAAQWQKDHDAKAVADYRTKIGGGYGLDDSAIRDRMAAESAKGIVRYEQALARQRLGVPLSAADHDALANTAAWDIDPATHRPREAGTRGVQFAIKMGAFTGDDYAAAFTAAKSGDPEAQKKLEKMQNIGSALYINAANGVKNSADMDDLVTGDGKLARARLAPANPLGDTVVPKDAFADIPTFTDTREAPWSPADVDTSAITKADPSAPNPHPESSAAPGGAVSYFDEYKKPGVAEAERRQIEADAAANPATHPVKDALRKIGVGI